MSFIRRMDHFAIVTDEPEKTKEFYGALGLHPGARPNVQVPGFWLYADEGVPILHVVVVKQMPNPVRGGLDHMAFHGENIVATTALLDERKIEYRLRRAPAPFLTWQLFCFDPNGIEVELDFNPEESAPAGKVETAGQTADLAERVV
jgi:catechol 2,3-dioxygenase-like lactoylglutathione lyase family enzyme